MYAIEGINPNDRTHNRFNFSRYSTINDDSCILGDKKLSS